MPKVNYDSKGTKFAYKGDCRKCGGPVKNATGYPYHLACGSTREAAQWASSQH